MIQINFNCYSIDQGELPPLRKTVLCHRREKPFNCYFTPNPKIYPGDFRTGYLFELQPGERNGHIDGARIGDKSIALRPGGTFWAFPAIMRLEDVDYWFDLPEGMRVEEIAALFRFYENEKRK